MFNGLKLYHIIDKMFFLTGVMSQYLSHELIQITWLKFSIAALFLTDVTKYWIHKARFMS
ncbi:hypothetical protein NSMS1_58120 [Nostoc sp. MS1]|nr:hypothetical protein NSMS1_58120 [Nostoc sp. MS1]